jgi:hypothetical protein
MKPARVENNANYRKGNKSCGGQKMPLLKNSGESKDLVLGRLLPTDQY